MQVQAEAEGKPYAQEVMVGGWIVRVESPDATPFWITDIALQLVERHPSYVVDIELRGGVR
jgi:spore germination cell wall hydrolase CwlJ-like protein